MEDRPRKDRLIQTRVPQDLESTLKDEARKRRLSVSHLIRNVLEDTFSLVDNVVSEVDRVVTDSVEMAQTLKRDAQRLAATARGETAHREPRRDERGRATREGAQADDDGVIDVPSEPEVGPSVEHSDVGDARAGGRERSDGPLADVYGFQELILNRPARCAVCGTAIARGARAYLGMTDEPNLPRVWVCQDCLAEISG